VADVDTYNRITLKFETPYARRGGAHQTWHLKFSLSGDDMTDHSDIAATASDLAAPVLLLCSPNTSYTGFLYYQHGSNINYYQESFEYGVNPGSGDGYDAGGSGRTTQLEVVALCRAAVGVSAGGKPVYLMKHVHDVYEQEGSPGVMLPPLADVLDPWSTGCGPNDLVTVSPTTGDASAAWTIDTALYTRQLRRGYIPKA
jgi:hypothetical protein